MSLAGLVRSGSDPDWVVLAHGVGGRQDLPIPFSLALVGAVVALLVSFAALGWLWREPRLRGETAGRPVPIGLQRMLDSTGFRWALRILGLLLVGFVVMAATLGPDRATNPTATWIYVLFWVGLVPASILFGPVWRQLNPLRTLQRGIAALLGTRPEEGLRPLPSRLGYWPAAVSLFAFTWLELVAAERTTLPVLRAFFTIYFVVHLMASVVYGSHWFDRADGFEVYSSLLGRLSPLGRRADGRLVLRSPFNSLDGLAPAAGLVATVCVLLGSTAYDGFSNSPFWIRFTSESDLSPRMSGTMGLLGFVLLAVLTYSMATWLAGVLGSQARDREHAGFGLPTLFAHSIIPIAAGYLIAHYFSLLVFEGQHALIFASDPLLKGWNLFGTAERGVDFTIVSASTIAVVQVLAIVIGHICGVVAAHDRAVRLFPRRQAVAGQLPLLVLMVCYTVGGLLLLFST
ncbi:MAG: hypothetical protein L0Y54_02810 [Sporichthyaceae bacterium]|nr:hypothetical protein [Sporichthyaceae bacterium]